MEMAACGALPSVAAASTNVGLPKREPSLSFRKRTFAFLVKLLYGGVDQPPPYPNVLSISPEKR
jgi:hypothetical protein